jgi:hypothetical protein
MADVFKTIIVKAADQVAAQNTAATVPGGEGMFQAGLTTDPAGAPPATHYISSGYMPEEIVPLMWPSSADVSDQAALDAEARLGLRAIQVGD